jgi:hypothetical protein
MTHVPQKITELMAWICTEPDGGDGIPAVTIGLTLMPLVGSDMTRMVALEPYARAVAEVRGMPVRLVRFSQMEVLRELTP